MIHSSVETDVLEIRVLGDNSTGKSECGRFMRASFRSDQRYKRVG
jgi:hypothetical protein